MDFKELIHVNIRFGSQRLIDVVSAAAAFTAAGADEREGLHSG